MSQLSVTTYAALRKKVEEELLIGQQKISAGGRIRPEHCGGEEARVQTYWNTGRYIEQHLLFHKDRADYGDFTLLKLSKDLDVGKRLLERVLQFYRAFPSIASAGTQLSWTHYRALLAIPDDKKRLSLAEEASKKGWVSRELEVEVRNLLWDKRVEASDGEPPSLLPVPVLGPFYAYKILEPETTEGRLLIDLGFSCYRHLDAVTSKVFRPSDIIESLKTGDDQYKLQKAAGTPDDLYVYRAKIEKIVDGDSVPRNTAQEMRVGPSEPICGNGLQSTLSGFGQKPWL